MSSGRESPTNVDAPLDYITVENYTWPKYEPPKRARLEEEERKRRHREGQRQFMQRKRCRVKILRKVVCGLEMQLEYMKAMEEARTLANENSHLEGQITNNGMPASNRTRTQQDPKLEESFGGVEESEVLDSTEIDNILCEVLSTW